jgi:pimeloyl-ACP methyl ester carboxylesterase
MSLSFPFTSPFVETPPQGGRYFTPPSDLLDNTLQISQPGAPADAAMYTFPDGRLIQELRNFAATADPAASLSASIFYFFMEYVFVNAPQVFPATVGGIFQGGPFTFDLTSAINAYPGGGIDTSLGNMAAALTPAGGENPVLTAFNTGDFARKGLALADLAVSGANSQAMFISNWSPGNPPPMLEEITWDLEPMIEFWMTNADALNLPPLALNGGDWNDLAWSLADRAFDRALGVLEALIGSSLSPMVRRRFEMEYIAVSGEDDLPLVPVNVPRVPGPQYTTQVQTSFNSLGQAFNNTTNTRFTIATSVAGAEAEIFNPDLGFMVNTSAAEMLAQIGDNSLFILFIHGHMSRIEEGSDLIPELLALASPGQPITVIAMDLPGMGYASCPLDTTVQSLPNQNFPAPQDISYPGNFPHLKFIETFITAFLEQLQLPHLDGIIGGSLGGHMGLRLAMGGTVPTIVWSPISIEPSVDQLPWIVGVMTAWQFLGVGSFSTGTANSPEVVAAASSGSDSRYNYFNSVFASPAVVILGLTVSDPQPVQWYRRQSDFFPSNQMLMQDSSLDRMEIYREAFRLWHWRSAYECVLFSFMDTDPFTGIPRYLQVTAPLMLCAGARDNYCPTPNLLFWTAVFAQLLASSPLPTPPAMFPLDTGHSIHNERPKLLASAVVNFINTGAGTGGQTTTNVGCVILWFNNVFGQSLILQSLFGVCSYNATQALANNITSCANVCNTGGGLWGTILAAFCWVFVGVPCILGTTLVILALAGVSIVICSIVAAVSMGVSCTLTYGCSDCNPNEAPTAF